MLHSNFLDFIFSNNDSEIHRDELRCEFIGNNKLRLIASRKRAKIFTSRFLEHALPRMLHVRHNTSDKYSRWKCVNALAPNFTRTPIDEKRRSVLITLSGYYKYEGRGRGWGGGEGCPIGIKIADYFLAASAAVFSFHFPRNESDATTDWIQFRDALSTRSDYVPGPGVGRFPSSDNAIRKIDPRGSIGYEWETRGKTNNLKDTRLEGRAAYPLNLAFELGILMGTDVAVMLAILTDKYHR